MKRFLITLIFISMGSGLWWLLSSTHHSSLKKWDAQFDSVLREQLNVLGFENKDVLGSLNILNKDDKGEWVSKQLILKKPSAEKINSLREQLEKTGAHIEEKTVEGQSSLYVKRGRRVYYQIEFQN